MVKHTLERFQIVVSSAYRNNNGLAHIINKSKELNRKVEKYIVNYYLRTFFNIKFKIQDIILVEPRYA